MRYHEVISQMSMIPMDGSWLVEAKVMADGVVRGRIYPVLALQSKIVNYYKTVAGNPTAPHHSELLKNGWTYVCTKSVFDPIILDEEIGEYSALSERMDNPNSLQRLCKFRPSDNDVADIVVKLQRILLERETRKLEEASEEQSADSIYNVQLDTVDEIVSALDRYTKPSEQRNLLFRILAVKPKLTMSELKELCKNLKARDIESLLLRNLMLDSRHVVLEDKMCLANGHMLAKLPKGQQHAYVYRAINMDPVEFAPLINKRLKQIKEATRSARKSK